MSSNDAELTDDVMTESDLDKPLVDDTKSEQLTGESSSIPPHAQKVRLKLILSDKEGNKRVERSEVNQEIEHILGKHNRSRSDFIQSFGVGKNTQKDIALQKVGRREQKSSNVMEIEKRNTTRTSVLPSPSTEPLHAQRIQMYKPIFRPLDRIDTDFILPARDVHDVNQLLDDMNGARKEQAITIMRGLKDKMENEIPTRRVTFYRDNRLASWGIRIQDRERMDDKWHWRNYPRSHLRSPEKRFLGVDSGVGTGAYNESQAKANKAICEMGPGCSQRHEFAINRPSPAIQNRQEDLQRQEDRKSMPPPPLPPKLLASSQACPPSPKLKPTEFAGDMEEEKAVFAAGKPSGKKFTTLDNHLRSIVRRLRNNPNSRGSVATRKRKKLEREISEATDTFWLYRSRNKLANNNLGRVHKRPVQVFQRQRRWKEWPGAMQNVESAYHCLENVVESPSYYYTQRPPSPPDCLEPEPKKRRLLLSETEEAPSSTEPSQSVTIINTPKHNQSKNMKAPSRLEGWQLNPDHYWENARNSIATQRPPDRAMSPDYLSSENPFTWDVPRMSILEINSEERRRFESRDIWNKCTPQKKEIEAKPVEQKDASF